LADQAQARSNRNPGRNTYLWQDASWTRSEAARVEAIPCTSGGSFGDGRNPLWGLPVSVKDCFDLAGASTSCGVHFYRDLNGIAARDSWLVEQLRASGAVIIGKTHLHPLAYGITGENLEFGDCLQPGNPGALTGGSSSGAVASVLEGSAVAAIGTDTGGSVRVPASLSGLAGYRATIGRGDWRGGAHLAESFDTMGWLFRDLEDAPLLAGPFAPAEPASHPAFTRFAAIPYSFLYDCEPEIAASFHATIRELEALGLEVQTFDPSWWTESREIFAPIQAWEAARLHAGHFDRFEPQIRQRLEQGARINPSEIGALRQRHAASTRSWTSCSRRTSCSCSPAPRLPVSPPEQTIARRAPVCSVTPRHSALPGFPRWPSPAPSAACNLPLPVAWTSRFSNSPPGSGRAEMPPRRNRAHDSFPDRTVAQSFIPS